MYICVGGVIGVGKTTLARMISDESGFRSDKRKDVPFGSF